MKKIQMRRAIAMIELIFAIVVMAIVLMSAPMLVSTATKSGYVSMQQESIAAASSEISMILTRHWDEQNTDPDLPAPILATAGDPDLSAEIPYPDGNSTIGLRLGTPRSSHRNFLTSLGGRIDATLPATLGPDTGDRDDIDDFDGNTATLQVYTGPSGSESTTTEVGDYIDNNINLDTIVSYISDVPNTGTYAGAASTLTFNNPFTRATPTTAGTPANTSNIKLVTVTLTTNSTSVELNKTIVLEAFSCNIGTFELNKRNF